MTTELPYIVEYAKNNRASCKTCKDNIGEDSLRMGVMIQSPIFDGKIPVWYHIECFFKKQDVKNVADIANFDNLRWEDQKKIKEKIAENTDASYQPKENLDFSVEYARSARACCRTCGETIEKSAIRISKLITDTPEAERYGPIQDWRHVDCFVKDRFQLDFPESADKLLGFNKLEPEDKKMLLEKITSLGIKRKVEELPPITTKKVSKEEVLMKSQNVLLFGMRDKLRDNLSKKEMIELLEYNNQHVSKEEQNIRDHLSDCLVFGAIKTCPECKNSAPRYKIDAYRCSGNLTEWTRCQYVTRYPERQPFQIPDEYKEKYDFLRNYKFIKRERMLPEKTSIVDNVQKGRLSNYIVAVFGKFNSPKSLIEKKLVELGAVISQKVDPSVKFCISTEDDVINEIPKVKLAQKFDIHIVSPKFIESVKNGMDPIPAIKENLISSWSGDPMLKLGIKQEYVNDGSIPSTSSSKCSTKTNSRKVKVPIQAGAIVDRDSRLANKCHVYENNGEIFSAVLGMVDLSRGLNTYYKFQILESNTDKKCYLFRKWGRVGTTIGDKKLEKFKNITEAIQAFEALYLEKTGNEWNNRQNFVKKPGCLYPLDIDYGQDKPELKSLKPGGNCELPKPVQNLICLIFDIEAMKDAMVHFEIDLKKMPLGKLSKKQIEQAYSVLNEAQQIINTGSNPNKLLDVSNKFYTLIPHDFGLKCPPKLDNEELIKSKIEMLDSLLEIELAYSMLVTEVSDNAANDPVTKHYKKLNTDIDVLEKDSEEFKIIEKYLMNTHGQTHSSYSLKINDVFRINRHGENERYQEFKNLHNKKLLWHGSRLTNFVGILSKGLRIAPPEAPVTGYMFGKGVYFADMVSKSARYCCSNISKNRGLLLLCEVALGNMYEKKYGVYIQKLPKNKHSTKGLGMYIPNPLEAITINGVEIPYGRPIPSGIPNCYLQYNEYIVYNVKQINIKYLLDVSFKYSL